MGMRVDIEFFKDGLGLEGVTCANFSGQGFWVVVYGYEGYEGYEWGE